MARLKCKRTTSYQPACKRFFAEKDLHVNPVKVLAEEIEALYLMDILELYQEDAAQKMGISRPTFTRILKSARQKVTRALLGGMHLELERTQDEITLAFCSDAPTEHYTKLHPKANYLHIVGLKKQTIVSHIVVENPLKQEHTKPPIHLMAVLLEHRVNVFVSGVIGEGFRSVLCAKGVHLVLKDELTEETIKKVWIET